MRSTRWWHTVAGFAVLGGLAGCGMRPAAPAPSAAPAAAVVMHGAKDGSKVWIYDSTSMNIIFCDMVAGPKCVKLQPQ